MPSGDTSKYWFPAKRYGWGWGVPCAWQGWAVLISYLALVFGGIPLIHAVHGAVAYLVYVAALSVALTVICWVTGEPPRWRWGKRDT